MGFDDLENLLNGASCFYEMGVKAIIILLAAIIIMPSALSFDDSLFSASYLELQTDISGTVTSSYGQRAQLSEIRITYSLFPKKEYSSSYSISTIPDIPYDDPLVFLWNDLRSSYDFNVNTISRHDYIGSTIRGSVPFPQRSIPSHIMPYTQPSDFIDSDNRLIRDAANSIAEGETDLLKLQVKIAEFVRS